MNETRRDLLCHWIEIPTVNPMGRVRDAGGPVERPMIEALEQLFSHLDVAIERQTCSPIHESLVIRLAGRDSNAPPLLFESHLDTVPADDWPEQAFTARVEGRRVYGRRACDDKGPLASMVLALLGLIEENIVPPAPIVLLAAGDEEYGQTGIRTFLAEEKARFSCGVFGEPTEGNPLVQHKGTIRWDITTRGPSAHTSRPELGRNAILDMTRVIACLADIEVDLKMRYTSELLTPPTLTVSQISGGRTRNAVPDECTIAVDFRILPGMSCEQATDEIKQRIGNLDIDVHHSPFQCAAPPLATPEDSDFVRRVTEFCRAEVGDDRRPVGAPFGSDASWMPDDCPTIVLGPGNIAQAHAIDEFVDVREVAQCARVFRRIMLHTWSTESGNDP